MRQRQRLTVPGSLFCTVPGTVLYSTRYRSATVVYYIYCTRVRVTVGYCTVLYRDIRYILYCTGTDTVQLYITVTSL